MEFVRDWLKHFKPETAMRLTLCHAHQIFIVVICRFFRKFKLNKKLRLPLADLEKLDYHTACNGTLHFIPF